MSELTPFEEFKFQVQTQIDFIVSKFQDSMSKFEALVQVNKDISKENADLKSSVSNLESKFTSLAIDFSSFIVAHSDSVKAQSKVNEHFDKLQMNQTSINGVFRKDIENVVSECGKLKEKTEEILKTLPTLSYKIELVDIKYSSIPGQIAKLDDSANFCQSEAIKLKDMILQDKSIIIDVKNLSEKNSLDALSIAKNFSEFSQKTSSSIDELKKTQVYFQEAIPKVIDQKIAEIPKPVIPNIEEVKKAFQNQLEPVSLDAKNSALRSVNTESKLHILEKKIEQLKLILDQLTIGK
jgi:hypothetical protein